MPVFDTVYMLAIWHMPSRHLCKGFIPSTPPPLCYYLCCLFSFILVEICMLIKWWHQLLMVSINIKFIYPCLKPLPLFLFSLVNANMLLHLFKRKAYTQTAYRLWRNRMLRQSASYGTKYRVRQIVHKTTRTDINSRTLEAAVIV